MAIAVDGTLAGKGRTEMMNLNREKMTISEVLLDAYDLIEEYGWVQGGIGDKGSGFCLTGAIAYGRWPSELKEASNFMEEEMGIENMGIENDYVLKSKEEALSLLSRAAAKASESESVPA